MLFECWKPSHQQTVSSTMHNSVFNAKIRNYGQMVEEEKEEGTVSRLMSIYPLKGMQISIGSTSRGFKGNINSSNRGVVKAA